MIYGYAINHESINTELPVQIVTIHYFVKCDKTACRVLPTHSTDVYLYGYPNL
jgi:hypothetical protein